MEAERAELSAVASGALLPDSPEVAEAQAGVARARARVAMSVAALRQEVVRRSDWREWVRRQPLPFVVAAFALGFWLGRRR